MNNVDERRGATSASNAEADLLCPGRHLAQRGLPDTGGEYAAHGSVIHLALATEDPSKLTLEQRETYDRCLDIQGRKVLEFFGADAAMQAKVWRENPVKPDESRLWVKIPVGDKRWLEHSARPDCFWRFRDRALILEFKSLAGEVADSPQNLQLRDQQVLIRGKFLITGDIGVVVVQPLVTMNPEICVYTAKDSARALDEMSARVLASNDPKSPRVPGEVQCKWCRAKTRCLEYQRFAGNMVPMVSSLVDVPIEQWTPQQWGLFFERKPVAKAWLEAAESTGRALLEKDPAAIPGWGFKAGSKRPTILDAQLCFDRFTGLGGTLTQFMGTIKVGITRLKQAVHEATSLRGKALQAKLDELTAGIVEVNQDQPTVVRLEDVK